MPRAKRLCPAGHTVPHGQLCAQCRAEMDKARGSAASRGYGREHTTRFRPGVLDRHPYCMCTTCPTHGRPCGKPSTDADHYPRSRRELVEAGLDPDDPKHGRGLCHSCHSRSTAQHQPGGWNNATL